MSKIKKILVTGKAGQLGQSIQSFISQYPQYQFTFVGRDEMDLSRVASISSYFENNAFDLIINCAAYTAVDQAEKQQEMANAVNHLAVKQLAKITEKNESLLIHVSTDYVFDGMGYQPYVESVKTNPQNIYGKTKYKGECAIEASACKAIIIRTSWVYSEYGNNFVKTMLRLGDERDKLDVIFDQVGSPTYAKDLAKSILAIVDSVESDSVFSHEKKGIYHYSNEGVCSWYDFAKTIFELSNIACDVSPIETKNYPTPAKRPLYSVLNKAKIKQTFDLNIPYWKDSLQACLNKLQ